MKQLFTIVRQNRKILINYLNTLTEEELFTIPKGFNNNIWWNIAHVAVTQQKLVYSLSGLPTPMAKEWIGAYEKGTFPGDKPSTEQIEELKGLLLSLPEQTEKDYAEGKFTSFKSYMTTPKVGLDSVEDAIAFNNFHEGLHLGSILALVRAVRAA